MDNRDKSIIAQVAHKIAAEIVSNDKDQSDDTAVSRIALMGDTLTDVLLQKIASLEIQAALPGTTVVVQQPQYAPLQAVPAYAPQAAPQPQYAPQAAPQYTPQPQQGYVPAPIPGVAQDEGFTAWVDVVQNLNGWWDNRSNKKNPRGPDFKAKNTNTAFVGGDGEPVALWLSDKALPAFVKTHFGIR